ncbi:hypothetical protein DMH17_15315 [Raoultella planticola]|nr:hypothetical protein [Raoultella planticola]
MLWSGLPGSVLRSDARKTESQRGTPHIDFFPVLAVEANRLIVGANDSHLDFRIAVVHRQRRETPTNQKRGGCWLPLPYRTESFISR